MSSKNVDDDDDDNGDGVRQTHQNYLTKLFARHNRTKQNDDERRNDLDLLVGGKKNVARLEEAGRLGTTSANMSIGGNSANNKIKTDSTDLVSKFSSNKNIIAPGSRTASCTALLSVQLPSVSKNANISPQILRRTLYKLDKQKNKQLSKYSSTDDHHRRPQGGSMPGRFYANLFYLYIEKSCRISFCYVWFFVCGFFQNGQRRLLVAALNHLWSVQKWDSWKVD